MTEIVVTGPASPTLAALDDLAGQEVHVRRSSSYYDSLTRLNKRFRALDKPQMKLTLVPDALEDEDMMDMLGAGLLGVIVVDDWKAKLWAGLLPKHQGRGPTSRSPKAARSAGRSARTARSSPRW